ncbi:hypothetical protein BD414DRAFT_510883 [Trametes punicea]|nr:hypothetical protein BD414DRAFT_510883 [Trametes punicea]
MADRPRERPEGTRSRSWIGMFSASAKDKEPALPAPLEGKEQTYDRVVPYSPLPPGSGSGSGTASASSSGISLSFKRSNSGQSLASLVSPRPTTPFSYKKRSYSSTSLTHDDPNPQNALERTISSQSQPSTSTSSAAPSAASASRSADDSRSTSSFAKMSLASMLSSLTLSRSSGSSSGGGDDERRGRSERKEKEKHRSASFSGARPQAAATTASERDSSVSRARSQSPFRLRRLRTRERDPSPTVEALSQSDAESESGDSVPRIRPRNAFSLAAGPSDDESGEGEGEGDEDASGSDEEDGGGAEGEESWSEAEQELDDITELNTERNALIPPGAAAAAEQDVPDYLGEGVNVVVPPEPYFPTTLNGGHGRNPRRRKSTRPHDTMALVTSRPVFQRDRCTITVTHGDPERVRQETGKPGKRYVLASDLSEESRYALEWGIGTVLRDSDELIIVTVVENESKSMLPTVYLLPTETVPADDRALPVDPVIPNPADRATKLRAQQERQALAYILVRQATSLLQRTRLNVSVQCQAWHAKNSRHMILDIVDYYEPVMLIVGSRGLGKLKGILLGSTSHYLIQKCSVPVMVARRRLKRPPRRAAHLKAHRARVSLAQAAIDTVASKVDQDVANMRSEIERDDERRADGHPHADADVDDDVDDGAVGEGEGEEAEPERSVAAVRVGARMTESPPRESSLGQKVAGD